MTTLGELAASIAHEVNQPLTGIVTYGGACLRWINRPEPDLDEARHAVENMIAEGLRASEVIRCIRALARKDDSRRLLFHLGELAAETMSMVRHQAELHGIAIAQECAPGLPQVLGDRIQLQQVIINLLINAIQAMSSCVLGQRQPGSVRRGKPTAR
ncbi:sensor histidine kinase [Cupriavidus basilensis]